MAVDVGTAVAYLNLDTTAFNLGLQQAQSAISTFKDSTSTQADKITAIGSSLVNVGNRLTSSVTVPLANLGKSAIQNAVDFESAFAGVKKTISDSRFAEFNLTWEDLAQGIKDIAYETGISVEEVAGVMEIAGQLGVDLGEGGKGIIEFTRQMVLMGVTTDLTSAEAALSLARFNNIMGVSNDEVGNLTATIVDLGNNFATQEGEITTMGTRLASAGRAAGLSAQDVLALSTAISSAGIKAEAGASSMSTTLSKLTRYTTRWRQVMDGTYRGTEEDLAELTAKMDAIGRASGMSADEFTRAWEGSPIDALTMFISGLATADERGENMILLLDDMGMNAIRESNNLRALALSFENMSGTIDTANRAWDEASAMEEEAGKRFETLESRMGQLNERWKEMKREIAETLIPILERLMDIVQKLIDWWTGLDDKTQDLIVKIGIAVAVLGPLVTLLGHFVTTWGLIKGLFVAKGVAGVVTEAGKLEKVVNNFSSIGDIFVNQIGGVNNGLNRMTTEASGSAVELANVATNTAKANEGLAATETAATNAGGAVGGLWGALKNFVGIGAILGGGFLMVKEFMDMWKDGFDAAKFALFLLGDALVAFGLILTGVVTGPIGLAIAVVVALVAGLVLILREHWDDIVDGVKRLWEKLKGWWAAIWEGLKFVVGKIGEFFAWAWDVVKAGWAVIKYGAKLAWDLVKNVVVKVVQWVIDKVMWFVDKIVGLFKLLKYLLVGDPIVLDLLDDVASAFKAGFEFVFNIVKTILEAIVNLFKWLWEAAKKIIDGIADVFKKGFTAIKNFVSGIWNGIANAVNSAIETIGNFLSKLINSIAGWFEGLVTKLGTVIGKIIGGFKEGFSKVKDAIAGVFDKIKGHFQSFKDKVVGTATDVGNKFIDALKGGKSSVTSFFTDFMKDAIRAVLDKLVEWKDAGKEIISALWEGLKSKWDAVVQWFKDLWDVIKTTWENSWVGKAFKGVKEFFGNLFDLDGSHKDGLAYVPYDGYVAELHKGERVLTAEENRQYSNGVSTGSGTTINFYSNEKIDEYTAARELRRTMKDMELGLV